MVFAVGECLRRCDDDTLAGVDAEGVEVLHVADGDAVVVGVADDFVLDLFPAFEALLDEDLVGVAERVLGSLYELLAVLAEARAHAAEGVGGSDDDGEADFLGGGECFLDGVDGYAVGCLDVDALEHVGEDLAVLGVDYGLDWGAEDAYAEFFEDSALE